MARIMSLSLDENSWEILERIPKKSRSKFIREAIKMDDEFLTNVSMIVAALNNKTLSIEDFSSYVGKLTNVLEAQLEK